MSDIKGQLIKDSYNYVLQADIATGVVYRIGGAVPTNPIFQSGLTINQSFNYSDGSEQNGYVLTSDASGNASWQPISAATPSSGVTSITVGTGLSASSSTGAVRIIFTGSTGTNFTGGTVSGATIFTGGLSANTISATTYYNLPIDIRVTGGTYSSGTATFTNNTGGTFSVSGFSTGSSVTQGITGITAGNGISAFTTNNVTTIGFSGGTINSSVNFTNGLTANTISATTITADIYNNIPSQVAGLQYYIQYNNGTTFGADQTFTWDYTKYNLTNGFNSSIVNNVNYSAVVGGQSNTLNNLAGAPNFNNNAIIGGTSNSMSNANPDQTFESNVILGGSASDITEANNPNSPKVVVYNAILGGYDLHISDSYNSTLIGGESNSIRGHQQVATYANTIIGGDGHQIYNTNPSMILAANAIIGGEGNSIYESNNVGTYFNIIGGGDANVIFDSLRSGILAGSSNTIRGNSNYSVIVGGNTNNINGYNNSVILGGNSISATQDNFAYVPSLNINTNPVNDDTISYVLVRDGGTGDVKYRNASTLGGGGGIFTGGTVTGPTTFIAGVTANTLSLGSTPSLMTTTAVTISTGTNNVYSVPTNTYNSFHIDYNISGSSGLRAGSVVAIWDGVNVDYTDTSTNDIGNTTPVSFLVALSGGNAILQASVTTSTWRIKTIIRTI
jgi:hypothetical protein